MKTDTEEKVQQMQRHTRSTEITNKAILANCMKIEKNAHRLDRKGQSREHIESNTPSHTLRHTRNKHTGHLKLHNRKQHANSRKSLRSTANYGSMINSKFTRSKFATSTNYAESKAFASTADENIDAKTKRPQRASQKAVMPNNTHQGEQNTPGCDGV